MLTHPNHIPKNFNLYQNKLIRIISPFSGEQFKIELGGREEEFRELLATLLNIDSSYIKGLKDSYGNYYTLSSALNDFFIISQENNLFSLVLNISNKNKSKYKHYQESFDRNMLYNVNNNYHNRTEYNEIYISNSNKKLMKSKSNYRYTTLIKELIPVINRNFRNEEEYQNQTFYNDKWSLDRHPKYEKMLGDMKKKFDKEEYNILKELLKMENITIINCFKSYEKSKDKKELQKNLNSLYKKYHKKVRKDSSSLEEESSQEKTSKRTNKFKSSKRHSEKSESSSDSDETQKRHKKNNNNHHHHKKRDSSLSTPAFSSQSKSNKSSESNQESNKKEKSSNSKNSEETEEEEENSEESNNNFPIKCSSLDELIDNIKELLSNKLIPECLFTNDIDFLKKSEAQKTQLLKDEFGIKNFSITEKAYETIKNYYDDIMKKVIEKDMTEEEKTILNKLIKKKNKSIKLRFRALFRHNNYDLLSNDLKECIKDQIKRKKGSEHKIEIKKDESISINSNSNSSNENENDNDEKKDNNIGMDDSSKSIRKNEAMAKKKNNQKKQKKKESKSQKSNEEESIGQFKLLEMNNESKGESNSKKTEVISKSRKSSSKVANEKYDDNFEDNFIPLIKKMKEDGDLDVTDNEINILINEFNKKNELLLSFIEEHKNLNVKEDFIENIETFLMKLYKNKAYIKGETVNLINNEKKENNDIENNNNNKEEKQPYENEIINGLKGLKFSNKGNKKIINILIKNNVFIEEQMRNIEEDLEQNNNFIIGAFELVYITNNVQDLVENIKIRIENSQKEKENQIKNNLDIIMKSFSEEKQNKLKELYEARNNDLMNILESEMNDIKKVKASILNFLGKN